MNGRKIAICLMTISFIMIISGGFSSFVLGLKADRRETYKRVAIVVDEFEVFSTNTSLFEANRDELYNAVLSNTYFDTMYKDDDMVKEKLTKYEKLVDEITDNVAKLDSLCENVYYPEIEANTKCTNYKSIYEQVINYFVSDIKLYNKNIKKYNDYQTSKKSNLLIENYNTTKKYIDYNNDSKYDGKEE